MADEKNLVEINAKVVLDEKSLEKINTKLSNINDIKLKLGIDKSYFDNAIKEVKDKYNNQTGPHIKLKVGATFKELTDSIRNIANRADIANKKVKISVGADLSSFDKTLGSLENKGKDVKVKVGVDADTTKAISSIESINNKLNALKENKVAVGLDTSKALSEVDKLKDALKGFTSSKGAYATVKVSGDTRSASTHIQNLQAKIDKLKKDSEKALNLEVNVKNQKGLHNVVQNIRAHLEKIFSKEYYVKVNNRDAIVAIKKIDTALNTMKSNANMHVSATTNAKDVDVKVLQDLAGALKTLNSVYKKADNGTTIVSKKNYNVYFAGHKFTFENDDIAMPSENKLTVYSDKYRAVITPADAVEPSMLDAAKVTALKQYLVQKNGITTASDVKNDKYAGVSYWKFDFVLSGIKATELLVPKSNGGIWAISVTNVNDFTTYPTDSTINSVLELIKSAPANTNSSIKTDFDLNFSSTDFDSIINPVQEPAE